LFDRVKFLEDSLHESAETKISMIDSCRDDLLKAAEIIKISFSKGGKLMLCGNGGSAADSQHIATEFVIRLSHDVKRHAMPALALTTDSSLLTAGGNDIGFENVFARSIQGLGKENDVLIAISTSGNSKNVINGIKAAKEKGIKVIGFLGGKGGNIKDMTDVNVLIPSDNVQRIQEGHITAGHIVCEIVERELYDTK
jgi:D-sedoheptulose 7-phosphate isomerase